MQHHQAYQPLLPCVNKYLQYKWDRSCYDLHRKNVQSAKATINTNPPKVYEHLLIKRKKLKLEEERRLTIERENHMLLEKISHIMRTTGGIDCRNDYVTKSLHANKRQQELLQIVKANQTIFQRLSKCTPYYSVDLWHEQWLKSLNLMNNIGRFPYISPTQKHVMSNKNTAKSNKRTPHSLSSGKEASLGRKRDEKNTEREFETKSESEDDEPETVHD